MSERIKKYKGQDTSSFKHIPGISTYNNNYYQGLNNDLLFEKANDDNLCEWYLVVGFSQSFILIGETCGEDSKIN